MSTETISYQHEDTLLTCDAPSVTLRTLRLEDAPRFSAVLAADSPPSSKPLTVEQATGAITRMQESARTPTVVYLSSQNSGDGGEKSPQVVSGPGRVNLAVIDTKTSNLIGIGGYGAIHTLPPSAESNGHPRRAGDAGVVIDPEYRNRGIAVACMRMAIDWGFKSAEEGGLALDLVTITTSEDNEKMRKLVDQKLGLEGRGVAREGGPTGKEIYYELDKKAWEELRKRM